MKKSNTDTKTEETGMIRRGKYIFFIIDALFTMLDAAFDKPAENIFQIKRPEKTKTGYGTFCDGIFNTLPKKKVNITIISNGCRTAQRNPRNVCLYLIFISRHVKKKKSSLKPINSLQLIRPLALASIICSLEYFID